MLYAVNPNDLNDRQIKSKKKLATFFRYIQFLLKGFLVKMEHRTIALSDNRRFTYVPPISSKIDFGIIRFLRYLDLEFLSWHL